MIVKFDLLIKSSTNLNFDIYQSLFLYIIVNTSCIKIEKIPIIDNTIKIIPGCLLNINPSTSTSNIKNKDMVKLKKKKKSEILPTLLF